MINYEYISSTPLFRLLEEHPLAGSYLENLRLADLHDEIQRNVRLALQEDVGHQRIVNRLGRQLRLR